MSAISSVDMNLLLQSLPARLGNVIKNLSIEKAENFSRANIRHNINHQKSPVFENALVSFTYDVREEDIANMCRIA